MALMSGPDERDQSNEPDRAFWSKTPSSPGLDQSAPEVLAQDAEAYSSSAPSSDRGAGRFEPTVGDHLRLGQFVAAIDQASPDQLRDLCKRLAQQSLLVYPAMLRGLAQEAAENLAGKPWGERRSDELVAELTSRVKGASRLPEDS